jgi:hypothetical protein
MAAWELVADDENTPNTNAACWQLPARVEPKYPQSREPLCHRGVTDYLPWRAGEDVKHQTFELPVARNRLQIIRPLTRTTPL